MTKKFDVKELNFDGKLNCNAKVPFLDIWLAHEDDGKIKFTLYNEGKMYVFSSQRVVDYLHNSYLIEYDGKSLTTSSLFGHGPWEIGGKIEYPEIARFAERHFEFRPKKLKKQPSLYNVSVKDLLKFEESYNISQSKNTKPHKEDRAFN